MLYTKEEEVEVGDIIVIRLHFQQFVSYIMATRLNGENSTDRDNELEINDRENRMDNLKTRATLDTRHRNTTAMIFSQAR